MTFAKQKFVPVFGKPSPKVPNIIQFKKEGSQHLWEDIVAETGAGYFMNRFLFLFGDGLDRLKPCLSAWSFVVPPARDRMIIGRNAYGSLLVLEKASSESGAQSVYVLDPFRVKYSTAGGYDIFSLVGVGLPEKRIPYFFDTKLYDGWIKAKKATLEDDVILAPKIPFGLGGKLTASNFQEEDILTFYKTSAPIYEKAFAKMGRPLPAKGTKV